MAKKQSGPQSPLDLSCAETALTAFSGGCGIDCQLLSPQGEVLYRAGENDGCARCRDLMAEHCSCSGIHLYGARQSERFGGRYVYFCPCGMAWCSAPIILEGRLAASLACGPALIMDPEDFLSAPPWFRLHLSPQEEGDILAGLRFFSQKTPRVFGDISVLLLALAVYVGDSSRTLTDARESTAQQQSIGETMQELNALHAPPCYPLSKERELVRAIEEGDQPAARRLMNELLGHILFYTG
ncbi:MAG: PocR ligand-binding domain-containing protein, partial [Oscillospiraceae bacterium]